MIGEKRIAALKEERRRTAEVTWIDVAEHLPDDDITVLIALDDGEVWTGFHEAGRWHYVSDDPLQDGQVTDWAVCPAHPRATS